MQETLDCSSGEVAKAVARLSDRSRAESPSTFPMDMEAADHPGLYSWWADEGGLAMLSESLGGSLPSLIYVGQAGATSSRSKTQRMTTLYSRIKGNHLTGNISSSTFRQTLSAILRDPLNLGVTTSGRLDRESNQRVSAWMREHLQLVIFPWEARDNLIELEEAVLATLDPPLNLMGMTGNSVRTRLKALRKELNSAAL
jgi:hypothetical protein